jgi:hypothetical protein
MFGRSPRLPVDIAFGLEVEGKKEPSTKYVETMKERLKKAFEHFPIGFNVNLCPAVAAILDFRST